MPWKLPAFTRNFYVIASLIFLLWMLFFDANDFITQYQMSAKVRQLEQEKQFYSEKIKEVQQNRRELLSNPELLEKFAREKYLMKKPAEDVFVILEDDEAKEK